jgi:hypothetical protein
VRDPYAVGCKAKDRLGWAEQKALLLIVAQCPDGLPAWTYAAQLAAVLDVPEDAQEAIYREAVGHRETIEGHAARTD